MVFPSLFLSFSILLGTTHLVFRYDCHLLHCHLKLKLPLEYCHLDIVINTWKRMKKNNGCVECIWSLVNAVILFISVELRGIYSKEMKKEYEAYCKEYGNGYSIMLCIVTPILPLMIIMGLNAIPLDDPGDGLVGNIAFVLVNLLEVWLACAIIIAELKILIPEFNIGLGKALVITLGYTVTHLLSYLLTYFVLSSQGLNAFPVPFTTQVGATFGFGVSTALVAFFVRNPFPCLKKFKWRTAMKTPKCKARVLHFCYLVLTQTSVIYTYAMFGALFVGLPPIGQQIATIGLPVLKLGFKILCSKFTEQYGCDVTVLFSIFTAELFNAIYVSIFLQRTNSSVMSQLVTISAIMLIDIGQNWFYIQNFKDFLSGKMSFPLTQLEARSLRTASKITKRSKVIPDNSNENSTIAGSQKYLARTSSSYDTTSLQQDEDDPASPEQLKIKEDARSRRFLYMAEYIVLTEYVEVITPVIYMAYSCFMFFMPNKQYIYGLRTEDLSFSDLQTSTALLSLYAFLEFLSCYAFRKQLLRLVEIDILKVLGFVLRKHRYMVCSFITTWSIVIMGFQSVHHGVDFTLSFKWFYTR